MAEEKSQNEKEEESPKSPEEVGQEETIEDTKKEPKKKWFRTFSTDMAAAARTEKGKKIRKTIEEAKQREEEKKQLASIPKLNLVFVISGVLLVVIGIVLFYLGAAQRQAIVEEKSVSLPELIFSEVQKEVELTGLSRQKIIETITSSLKNDRLEYDSIENLILTEATPLAKKIISPRRFFDLIESQASATFLSQLGDLFMLGIYARDANHLFILLKTPSFEAAAPGLKAWEERIVDDLYELFDIDVSGDKKILFNQLFEDKLVNNKNSRVILDKEENISFMYQFINDQTIIITTSVSVLREVTNRITAGRVKR